MPVPAMVLLLSSLGSADDAGDALARKVMAATGDIYAISRLSFTFVVEAAGKEKTRRTHDWNLDAGTLTVTMGGQATNFTGLHHTDPSLGVAEPEAHAKMWSEVTPGVSPDLAAKAWTAWINDSYWLLASGKVMDAGVSRAVDESGRLLLTFDGVGITPGDQYTLTVDPDTQRVSAWQFELEGGKNASFVWTEHQTFGPLTLSLHRATESGDFVIRFEGLAVSP